MGTRISVIPDPRLPPQPGASYRLIAENDQPISPPTAYPLQSPNYPWYIQKENPQTIEPLHSFTLDQVQGQFVVVFIESPGVIRYIPVTPNLTPGSLDFGTFTFNPSTSLLAAQPFEELKGVTVIPQIHPPAPQPQFPSYTITDSTGLTTKYPTIIGWYEQLSLTQPFAVSEVNGYFTVLVVDTTSSTPFVAYNISTGSTFTYPPGVSSGPNSTLVGSSVPDTVYYPPPTGQPYTRKVYAQPSSPTKCSTNWGEWLIFWVIAIIIVIVLILAAMVGMGRQSCCVRSVTPPGGIAFR